jgi:hypothetical protein
MLTLVRRSMGRLAWLWTGMIVLLAGFQASIIAAAVSLEAAGDFNRLVEAVPAFVREAIGPALMSFAGMSVLSFFEPLLILLCVLFAMYVATEPAGDVESGLVDLLLARPLPRHVVVTRSLLVITVTALSLVLSMGLVNVVSIRLMATPGTVGPTPGVLGLMMVHLFALTWCFGALTLGVASGLARRSTALGVMTLFAGAMYLVNLLAVLSPRFEPVGALTLFHYFQGSPIILGRAPTVQNLSVLFGTGVVGVAAAYVRFARRDL